MLTPEILSAQKVAIQGRSCVKLPRCVAPAQKSAQIGAQSANSDFGVCGQGIMICMDQIVDQVHPAASIWRCQFCNAIEHLQCVTASQMSGI